MRDGVVQRLTEDHTKVQELVRAGAITEEQARSHPQRSIITRALGTRPDIAVDTSTLAVRQGDRLLLCTDGLTGLLPDEEVRSILLGNPAPQQAADRLVEAALAAGGSDNVTAIVVDVEEPGAFPSAARPGLLFAVSVGAALAGVLLGFVLSDLVADEDRAARRPVPGSSPQADPNVEIMPGGVRSLRVLSVDLDGVPGDEVIVAYTEPGSDVLQLRVYSGQPDPVRPIFDARTQEPVGATDSGAPASILGASDERTLAFLETIDVDGNARSEFAIGIRSPDVGLDIWVLSLVPDGVARSLFFSRDGADTRLFVEEGTLVIERPARDGWSRSTLSYDPISGNLVESAPIRYSPVRAEVAS